MVRGMLENPYQLVSEQFDPDMEDNTFGAQLEEGMRNLQRSQIELKETYEHHGKLLTEILRCLENLRAAHSVAKARDNIAVNPQGVDGSCLMTGWNSSLTRGICRYGTASAPEEPITPPVQVNYTQLLINGQLVDAALGKTFPTLDPTTGEVIVHVDEEKELEFKFVPVNIAAGDHKKEPSISQIPFGQAPALEDGDLKLIDLRAIMKGISASKGMVPIYRDSKKKMTIVIKQIVVEEAEEPKKMVIYLKNASSLVLELCGTFFTGETQSSITYCNILYLLVLSITNTLYLLSILEISWSGFALHKWWQNAQFLPLGELSAHPATILQQLLKMIAGVDISEVEVNDGEFSRGEHLLTAVKASLTSYTLSSSLHLSTGPPCAPISDQIQKRGDFFYNEKARNPCAYKSLDEISGQFLTEEGREERRYKPDVNSEADQGGEERE
ncbi:hypothetical protein MRB53_032625 [Persea americana]|uniref:Uncharacterized protein n=1 Tax=Persea americana TaxID=3435 RepID=A0ACC2KSX4_PERAE|nr:hypothetical protein MRB53_032625 [Persea americana]